MKERDALKSEVERQRAENERWQRQHESKDKLWRKAVVERADLMTELKQERERNAGLVAALWALSDYAPVANSPAIQAYKEWVRETAKQVLQSAAKQEMSPKAQSIDISQERVADDDKQDETK
jgi:hypothetical protein